MPSVDVNCQKCGTEFSVDTEYFEVFGKDPFCQDCLIHTKCQSCDRPLRLEPSEYQRVGGDPVTCKQCEQTHQQTSSNGGFLQGTFWEGLSTGEKIVFPILVVLLVTVLGFLALAAKQGYNTDAGIVPAGLLFLTYWTYRRGKKNK